MNQASSRGRPRDRRRRRNQNPAGERAVQVTEAAKPVLPKMPEAKPRRYGVVFFENFVQAKANLEELQQTAASYDQLNIVIQADGDMDDPQLCQVGKVFAGEAWTLIHRRRQDDGWYDQPQSP